jgi:integrase
MPTKRNDHGLGSIQQRGENAFRLRYRANGQRHEVTFKGSRADAKKELRSLLKDVDDNTHVDPSRITVAAWISTWIELGCPGRRRKKVSQRTLERYSSLLLTHVVPVIGHRPLQQLMPAEIDRLYRKMDAAGEIAVRTQHHVHTVFSACMAAALRMTQIKTNPMVHISTVPDPNPQAGEDDVEEANGYDAGMTEAELTSLIEGFRSSTVYPVVALAAATGARRNELLALRWVDLDVGKKTLRIERALEQTRKFGIRTKLPKTKRGRRVITLDDATIRMLIEEKERMQRAYAGIPEGGKADLSLIKLPAAALMFPTPPSPGEDISFVRPRSPRNFSKYFREFCRRIGREGTRFHVLRGVDATALLDAGIPLHTVAQRIGDDPATLLRHYTKTKRTEKADDALTSAISEMTARFLKT